MSTTTIKVYVPLILILLLSVTKTNAQSSVTKEETTIQYLSGTGMGNTVDWEFYCSDGRKSGEWTTVAVPSCWEQQGFGNYNYGHDAKGKKKSTRNTDYININFLPPPNGKTRK